MAGTVFNQAAKYAATTPVTPRRKGISIRIEGLDVVATRTFEAPRALVFRASVADLETVIDTGMEPGLTETWDRLADHLADANTDGSRT